MKMNLIEVEEINPLRSRSEIAHLSDLRSLKVQSTCAISGLERKGLISTQNNRLTAPLTLCLARKGLICTNQYASYLASYHEIHNTILSAR